MKILFCIPHLQNGGPNRVFYEIIKELSKKGFIIGICVDKDGGEYWEKLSENIHKYKTSIEKKYPYNELAKIIDDWKPDIVIATLGSIITATIAKFISKHEWKLIIRPANPPTKNTLQLVKKSPVKHSASFLFGVLTLNIADIIVSQSDDLKKEISRMVINKRKIYTIGNPITITEEVSRVGLENHITAIGRLAPEKNFQRLIKAYAISDLPKKNIKLKIFGQGPEKNNLNNLINKLKINDKVFLMGETNQSRDEFKKCLFGVLSSNFEGFPNVVLEGMAEGCPFLSTNISGGVNDLIIPGATGWISKSNSIYDFSISLSIAASDTELIYDSESTIKNHIKNNFSTKKIINKYINLISS